ncbi:MAG: peptidoglycan DD-metalloendopeptidase family protein [Aquamicrobium sp.]|uniref:peptidoglycan DD-metalloendopeptidase family protein n=1 Tax=Aquamicrobium sp. TaxID=1872579 RepID=UPI00349E79FA|nr:peptidoglycan DD-metalloendopeptidase family protein [Aquamicrobium sp.]
MRSGISGKYRRSLAHGAAIVVAGGLLAGCSSDVMRFQDSILTGDSRPVQPAPVAQAYPGDYSQVDTMSTGSVAAAPRRGGILNRAGLVPRPQGSVSAGGVYAQAPVQQPVYNNSYPAAAPQSLPPVSTGSMSSGSVSSGPALAPVTRASLDTTVTGSTQPLRTPAAAAVQPVPVAVQPAPPTLAQPAPASTAQQPNAVVTTDGEGGWMRAGGTQITVKPGETVYNLSRRFGVPTDAILKANGLSSANALAAGQQIVIPTYVHSARAPVSAPDANPNVADARSSTGTRYDVPAGRTPTPSQAPGERVAVLPQQPAPKSSATAEPAAPNPATPASAGGTYTVVAGDTLHGIARKTGASTEAIKQANGLSSGLIRIGQKLTIPAGGGAAPVQTVAAAPKTDQTTTAAVNRPSNVYTPPKQAETAIQKAAADASAPAPNASGISKMRWPVRGRVISGFGSGSGKANDGIDIAVPAGTPVKAAENGVVIYAGDGLKEFGNTVLVRHENGLVTVYGHASELKVQRGQKVRRGEDIALAGMSGSADTPKLHFEVRKDSSPVDPKSYLE